MELLNVECTKTKLGALLLEDYFYFVRFGDGDLTLIEGASSEQRHKNSPELRAELTEAIKIYDDRYIVSSTAGAYGDGSGAYFWIADARVKQALDNRLKRMWCLARGDKDSYHALVFQNSLEFDPAWLKSFFTQLTRDKKVLFLAGEPLCGKSLIHKALNVNEEISFEGLSDSYYSLHHFMDTILEAVDRHDIILPVLGMGSRVLAKRLWKLGLEKTVLDLGVTVDALARADHRGWTRRMIKDGFVDKFEEIL